MRSSGSKAPDCVRRIYDISPVVSKHIKVWPGDSPFSREILLDREQGANITLSTLRSTVHVGAHADAPSHYAKGGAAIDQRALDFYLGRCQIFEVRAERGALIAPKDLEEKVEAERVLLKTGTFPNHESWNTDFAAPSPKLIDFLHEKGVRLVGVDTPSVDLFASKDLPSHQRLLKHDMANLEGLALENVPAGMYELIALPLRLEGFDASPVRAILRTL